MKINSAVSYTVSVIRKGKEIQKQSGHNMLTDGFFSFLTSADNAYKVMFTGMLGHVKFGTSGTSNSRDSGAVTFTTDNGSPTLTVTASASFFVNTDVGHTLKLDSGEELYITGFTSATVVTCSAFAGGTVTDGQQGTVWFTGLGGLVSAVASPVINNYGGGFNNNNSMGGSTSVNVGSGTAVFSTGATMDSTPATATAVIREMGWYAKGVNQSMFFGRAVLGVPLVLAIGDIIRLTWTFTANFDTSPKVISAGAFSGTTRFYGGTAVPPAPAENNTSYWGNVYTLTAAPDISVLHTGAPGSLGTAIYFSRSTGTTHDNKGGITGSATYTVSQANGTIYGFSFGNLFVHKLDTPVTKLNTQTLNVQWKVKYVRDLPN